jgi:hypothetical protein
LDQLSSPFKWGGVGVFADGGVIGLTDAVALDPSVADDRAASPYEWGGKLDPTRSDFALEAPELRAVSG